VIDVENGVQLEFKGEPGMLDDIVRVMEEERECCKFFRFTLVVEAEDGPIVLRVTGPPGTTEALKSL
jgi:hypothetical protein